MKVLLQDGIVRVLWIKKKGEKSFKKVRFEHEREKKRERVPESARERERVP